MAVDPQKLIELRERLASQLLGDPERRAKRVRGRGIEFRCVMPDHTDGTASAWLGDYGWNCKGCGHEGNLKDLAGQLGIDAQLGGQGGYRLEDYAAEKGLALEDLRRWQVGTVLSRESEVVEIPYLDAEGQPLRSRLRGQGGKKWWGPGQGVYPYGLWILEAARTRARESGGPLDVLLVEGESDCHACWSSGVLAIGLPGASTWQRSWEAHLEGCRIFVWDEGDRGAAQLLAGVARSYPQARVVSARGAKDPCQLRQQDPDAFRRVLLSAMQAALPIGTPEPPRAYDVVDGALMARIAEQKRAELDVVQVPFPALAALCGDEGGEEGWAYGWHVLIGGATNSRKSVTAMNAAAAGVMGGALCAWHSLEMSQPQNVTRYAAILSGVPIREISHGPRFREAAWQSATRAIHTAYEDRGGRLLVNRDYLGGLQDLVDSTLYYWEYHGVRMHVYDYLQLAWVKGAKSMQDEIIEVSHRIRGLAHEHKLLTLGISQITREASNASTPPRPSNLLGGSALENDADQILMMDHTRQRKVLALVSVGGEGREVTQDFGDRQTVCMVPKNRHGMKDVDIPLLFDGDCLRMTQRSLAPGEEW